MRSTETVSSTQTTARHVIDNTNQLSIFSYRKVQAMLDEAPPYNIYQRVKSMLGIPDIKRTKQLLVFGSLEFIISNGVAMATPIFRDTKKAIDAALCAYSESLKTRLVVALIWNIACVGIGYYCHRHFLTRLTADDLDEILALMTGRANAADLRGNFFVPAQTPPVEHILKKIRSLAIVLDTPPENKPSMHMLFQLIEEIQNLSFLSGYSGYDSVRESLVCYLKTHQEYFNHLRQHAMEQDKKKLEKMLKDLNVSKHLSLEQMDTYYELLEESTNAPKETPNTEQFNLALTRKLLSELPYLNKETLEKKGVVETIDQTNEIKMPEERTLEPLSIDNLIDKLHYVYRLFSLLNSYPALELGLGLSKYLCDHLTQCDVSYQKLRKKLLSQCSASGERAPRIWATSSIVRQINRTWIERYRSSPLCGHAINLLPFPPEAGCAISYESFDTMAPTVEQANNIVIFDADNRLYKKECIIRWGETSARSNNRSLLCVASPITRAEGHKIDVIPLTSIINMEQFIITNLLPESLPLKFIQG